MTLAPRPPLRLRLNRLGRALRWAGAALALWLALAYLALPEIWRRAERDAALSGGSMLTRTAQGIAGDPINFGLVGEKAEVLCAFRSAGWVLADAISLGSSIRIAGSVVLRRPDPAAPVSPLFYEDRVEDVAFERPVGLSAATRHHIRLWLAGDKLFEGRPLWLGAATYDRGVGISHFTLQVTHRIAPDLDAERGFVADSLDKAGAVEKFFQIDGAGPTLFGKNGGGDPYFTDGDALIGVLRPSCALKPDIAATPPDNPPHVELRATIVHALGRSR